MRTIKFRGKRVDNGQWVYGSHCMWGKPIENKLYQLEVGLRLDEYVFYEIIQTPIIEYGRVVGFSWERIFPETVGQFTGEKDDGQDDLYEGDIIRFGCGRTAIGAIRWSEEHCAWIVKEVGNKNEFMLSDCFDDFIEKIGNIHENPELLESK